MSMDKIVFKTIRQTAALGILPENQLRVLQKQGKLPGIKVGKQGKFLINVVALVEQLDKESRKAVVDDE